MYKQSLKFSQDSNYKQSLKPLQRYGYKQISDYGLIGNCRSAALVSNEASIDFACFPDFDSPAFFLKILDDKKGGFFKITPEIKGVKSYQKYIKRTNIIETFFFNPFSTVCITDFMPVTRQQDTLNHIPEYGIKIIRLVKAIKGSLDFKLEIKVTPDFAREKSQIKVLKDKIVFIDSKHQLILHKKHHEVSIEKDLVIINFHLKQGEQEFFGLDFYKKETALMDVKKENINAIYAKAFFETLDFWKYWSSICTYKGEYVSEVLRSALTLKLLTFTPTGGIIAAPTTSLPERLGGSLNWDYRFNWLRDSSFTIYALLGLGYLKEARRYMEWIESKCLKSIREGSLIQVMYTVRGKENLEEKTLNHLEGYMKSKPVRTGNSAALQKQFDIFGEVLIAINLYVSSGGEISKGLEGFIKDLVDYCCYHWREKDAGIWEPRYGYQHNTYSKLMCWAGIDRGISLAKKLKLNDVDLKFWEYEKEKIREDILKNGFSEILNSFVAFYGSDVLDTSTLNIPVIGFLPASDKRVLSSLEKIIEELSEGWFVKRTSDEKNELQAGEGAFFLSTFWVVDTLSLSGRITEGKNWLEKIIESATPLGLFAEEFNPNLKLHLGNYPQAFTHLGLINSVLNLRQAEKYGGEKTPTTNAERLAKVIKTLIIGNGQLQSKPKRTLSKLLSFFRLS